MTTNDRERTPNHRRQALVSTSVATLGLSLLLCISPAFAKADNANGNSGTVKVHDAATGLEAGEQNNEPYVCEFWVSFTYDSDETGSWVVLSWPPTGDGTQVESGTFDTTGDGLDYTDTISLPAGHYRLEWTANGDHNTKNKTFWVDEGCGGSDPAPVEDPAVSDPGASPDQGVLGDTGSNGPTTMLPDTGVPAPTGILAAIGILLMILAHVGVRKELHPGRA